MKRNYLIVGLIFFIFFVISFLTNIMGPLIPDIIEDFELTKGMAATLPFAFFIAYGLMSVPSGSAVEHFKEKKVLVFSFLLAFSGAILFGLIPSFPVALISLFLIGSGMAFIQVAINPLLRVSGGEEHFAFNSVMAQLVFGSASFLSPKVFSYLVHELNNYSADSNALITILHKLVPQNLAWVSLYWIFAIITLLMVLVVIFVKFPKVELKEDEKAGQWIIYRELLKNRTVQLFFVGIFAYVGTEQGIANWMSQFLADYHSFNPHNEGANAVAWFWGLLTIGCFLGLGLLKIMDSRKVLIIFSSLAIVSLIAALTGSASVAIVAFPICGFFASVMWSVIFSLALNSLPKNHGAFSGILCTGIIGGAIVPLVIGFISDFAGLKVGMSFIFITLSFILSIGFWAKPIITNKTINFSKKNVETLETK